MAEIRGPYLPKGGWLYPPKGGWLWYKREGRGKIVANPHMQPMTTYPGVLLVDF